MSWEKLDSSTRMGGRRARWREGEKAPQEEQKSTELLFLILLDRKLISASQITSYPDLCATAARLLETRLYVDPSSIGQAGGDSAAAQVLGWWRNCQSDQRRRLDLIGSVFSGFAECVQVGINQP